MREAEATEATINAAREGYRRPPGRAAALWFVVSDLPGLSPMYQTSLAAFKALFIACIGPGGGGGGGGQPAGGGGAGGGAALEARLAALTEALTAHIYHTVRQLARLCAVQALQL